jgi:Holliday junction resolvase
MYNKGTKAMWAHKGKKHVVDLIKMVKKMWVHIEAKENKKGNELCIIPYLLHW